MTKPEVVKSEQRAWCKDNRARANKTSRDWAKKNPEKAKDTQRRYHLKHRGKRNEKSRSYYYANRSRLLALHKEWEMNNPDKVRAHQNNKRHKRRAKENLASVPELLRIAHWMEIVRAKAAVICHWCETKLSGQNATFDHIIALASGGKHELSNLCIACKPCNCSKSDKDAKTWVSEKFPQLHLI